MVVRIMPTSFTIHDLDVPVAKRLALYASREDKSINQSVKELLAIALGVTAKPKVKFANGLGRFRGSVPKRDAASLLAFVSAADFSKVEAEDR